VFKAIGDDFFGVITNKREICQHFIFFEILFAKPMAVIKFKIDTSEFYILNIRSRSRIAQKRIQSINL